MRKWLRRNPLTGHRCNAREGTAIGYGSAGGEDLKELHLPCGKPLW